jgi:hypothetical protein
MAGAKRTTRFQLVSNCMSECHKCQTRIGHRIGQGSELDGWGTPQSHICAQPGALSGQEPRLYGWCARQPRRSRPAGCSRGQRARPPAAGIPGDLGHRAGQVLSGFVSQVLRIHPMSQVPSARPTQCSYIDQVRQPLDGLVAQADQGADSTCPPILSGYSAATAIGAWWGGSKSPARAGLIP